MKIAIFGAAGAIGRAVLPTLIERGHEVRLVGRSREKLEAMSAGRAEIVLADIEDPAAARIAADGADAVLFSVGLPYHESARYPKITSVALEAAKASGVREFLLISTVYPYGLAQTPLVAETHPRDPHTRKGRNRNLQLEAVMAAHDPRGMRTTAVILPDFYGPTADYSVVKEILDAAASGKTANVLGPIDRPHEYVFIPDVAPVIADLFDRPELFGEIYNFAGAGTINTRDFIAEVERVSGSSIKTLVANKTMLRLLGIGIPMMRELVEMNYLQTEPLILDDAKLRAALPSVHKTSYAAGIAQTLAAKGIGLAHV